MKASTVGGILALEGGLLLEAELVRPGRRVGAGRVTEPAPPAPDADRVVEPYRLDRGA